MKKRFFIPALLTLASLAFYVTIGLTTMSAKCADNELGWDRYSALGDRCYICTKGGQLGACATEGALSGDCGGIESNPF